MGRIEALETSDDHAKRVKSITGGLGLNRKNEHALTSATISYLVGIDVSEELRHGIETIAVANEEDEDEIEELNSALLTLARKEGPIEAADTLVLKQSIVKKFINDNRDRDHRKLLGHRRFAEIYRAAGIKTSWIRNRGNKNYWAIPMRHLQVLEGLANCPNSANFEKNLDQHTLSVGRVGSVDKDNIAARIRQEYESGATYDELAERFPATELDRLKIPRFGGREK